MLGRDEGAGRSCNQKTASLKRRYTNGVRQEARKARMHMGMVMVGHRRITRSIPIVNVIVTMLVAVVPEMRSMTRRVFQCIANAHR